MGSGNPVAHFGERSSMVVIEDTLGCMNHTYRAYPRNSLNTASKVPVTPKLTSFERISMSRQIEELSSEGIILEDGQALTRPELANITRRVGEAIKSGEIKVDGCKHASFFLTAASADLREIGRQGVVIHKKVVKTINDLCEQYENNQGVKGWGITRINEFLDNLRESPISRTKVPRHTREFADLYGKLEWLVNRCEPPFQLDAIEAYFLDCMQP